ncbi:hypothetical protein J2T17_004393 [Paenibacillus mucilaginosus]|uniref:hypothetical protein n=1 Tax=Paenibacillus mucilaginosus TaxID=61624 RepID=UPI003D238080
MDQELNQKYIEAEFSRELVTMFAEIIDTDTPLKRVLLFIGKHEDQNRHDEVRAGISIKQLTEQIITERKVRGRKGKYSVQETNIERKHAERLVEILLKMSLCYYVNVPPSKLVYLTKRGRMVALEVLRRAAAKQKSEEEKGVLQG